MKKKIALLLLFSMTIFSTPAFAKNAEEADGPRDMRVQAATPENAPRWTDYVPEKYQNPRTDFDKKSATKEIIWGGVLTDLIVAAPVGIPMICHGTTKLRNFNYAQKKTMFFNGLEEAATMSEEEQLAYYPKLIKQCKLKKQKRK